jgi:hypothetical protein
MPLAVNKRMQRAERFTARQDTYSPPQRSYGEVTARLWRDGERMFRTDVTRGRLPFLLGNFDARAAPRNSGRFQ